MEKKTVTVYVAEPSVTQLGVFQKGVQEVDEETANWLVKHRIGEIRDRAGNSTSAETREKAVPPQSKKRG